MFDELTRDAKTKVISNADLFAGEGDNMALADNWDDADGYYRARVGEVLDGRATAEHNQPSAGCF